MDMRHLTAEELRKTNLRQKALYYANCSIGETKGSRLVEIFHAAFLDVLESQAQAEREALTDKIPDYWKEAIGGEYKFAHFRKHSASHPTTVKTVMEKIAGTEAADVIAALVFQNCVAWETNSGLSEQIFALQAERDAHGNNAEK